MNQHPYDLAQEGRPVKKYHKKQPHIVPYGPEPVHVQLSRFSRRSAIFCFKMVAVFLGVFIVASGLTYAWISQNPVSLSFLVEPIETSISRELKGLTAKIDDAVVQRAEGGYGIVFRLKNVRLQDSEQQTIAQAPSAAIGLSIMGLLNGRIAPGHVDFIGPKLLLMRSEDGNLGIAFSKSRAAGPPENGVLPNNSLEKQPNAQSSKARTLSEQFGETLAAAHAQQVDLVKMIYNSFKSARQNQTTSSFLSTFGIRDAVILIHNKGQQSNWRVPDLEIKLTHHTSRSVMQLNADLETEKGLSQVTLNIEQNQQSKKLVFGTEIQNLSPRSLSYYFPDIDIFQTVDLPVTGKAHFTLSDTGELLEANTAFQLERGKLYPSWNQDKTLEIDRGQFQLTYSKEKGLIQVLPSSLKWGESEAVIDGEMITVVDQNGTEFWQFALQTKQAQLASEEFGIAAMPVDKWQVTGFLNAQQGRAIIKSFDMNIAGSSINFKGEILDAPSSPAIYLTGQFSPMPVSVFKQIWPRFLAPGARDWIGERIPQTQILGGNVNVSIPAGMLADASQKKQSIPEKAVQFNLELQDMVVHFIKDVPPLQAVNGSVRLSGQRLTLDVPQAIIPLPSGKNVFLAKGQFVIPDLRQDPPDGIISFHTENKAQTILEFFNLEPLGYLKDVDFDASAITGQTKGVAELQLPLLKDVKFADMKIKSKVQLLKAQFPEIVDGMSIKNGALNFDISEKAVHAKGNIAVNGVRARIDWQRIFKSPLERQPPIRLSTTLNASAFEKLGISVGHVLKGRVPTTITIKNNADQNGEKDIRVRADLTTAALNISSIGWRKPPGQRAQLEFDIKKLQDGYTELQNFKIVGDDLAVNGALMLDAKGKLVEVNLPDIALNVITKLAVSAKREVEGNWNIKINGPSLDGRNLFRSFFSGGPEAKIPKSKKQDTNFDLSASIQTIVGFGGTKINDVKIFIKKRKGGLVAFNANGAFNQNRRVAVQLRRDKNTLQRILLGETNDAGNTFKLVGFYPNILGGQASFSVNLDASGAAEQSGTLWARDFAILGDRIVQQVLTNTGEEASGFEETPRRRLRRSRNTQARERIPFDQLKIPFSVGQGQFVLHNAFISGPALRAKLAGKIDFERKIIDLGGTYIPLPGLSDVFQGIPIVNIFVGNGLWGVSFGVQGNLDNPEVIVNPASMLAPGIFREIFSYQGAPQEVTPR
ncbi:MAG: DUF3971 domain-containing protein [Pseudomonadota bacterium]